MSVAELQKYTFVSKYANWLATEKRRETWKEAVDRTRNMMLKRYPDVAEEINWAYDQVVAKRVLGSQRMLQYGGRGVEQHNARAYNCIVSHCNRLRFFQECAYLLLCGCGTGFSVQKHHINQLPGFSEECFNEPHEKKVFVVPDSIEGWADAFGVLLSTYFNDPTFPEYWGKIVVFDYSKIRPKGSRLSSGVGKAPGPEPLERSLERVRHVLEELLTTGLTRLRPIDAYDIVMHMSDAVLAGGVRRSATICLFSKDDEEMLNAKTGNWLQTNPQRARSNNSVLLLRGSTSWEEFSDIMQKVKEWGEPGFVWTDDLEYLTNPCCEIGFYPVEMETLLSGWQACNLCEINGKKVKSVEDFIIAARAAAIIGTLQAGYTSFPYLGSVSEHIIEREALLGVSITGMMENTDILFDPKIQTEMALLIKATNEELAARIGIKPAARTTCVKPAGTTSCILGTSSGIHPHHAKRYLRRVQANALEAPYQHFLKVNPRAVEKSVWSANETDGIITFCIEVEDGAKTKNQLDALTLLEHVRTTQQNWVIPGIRPEACVKPWLVHNVSNTITVREDEWEAVAQYIYTYRKFFAGISLLPISGDKDYPQAPFCAIHLPSEIVSTYGDASLFASGIIENALNAFNKNLWRACDCILGMKPADGGNQEKLVERAKIFADRYFDGDSRRMTYCLKDVYNWKLWCDLKREYQTVDYENCIEDEDNTSLEETIACAGGACSI